MDEEEEEEERRRRRRSAGKSSREREKERENVGNRGKSAFSKGEKRAAPTAACCFHKNIFRVFPFPLLPGTVLAFHRPAFHNKNRINSLSI